MDDDNDGIVDGKDADADGDGVQDINYYQSAPTSAQKAVQAGIKTPEYLPPVPTSALAEICVSDSPNDHNSCLNVIVYFDKKINQVPHDML